MVEALHGHTVVLHQVGEGRDQGVDVLGSAQGIVGAGVRVSGRCDQAEIVVRRQILAVQLVVLLGAPIVLAELVRLVQLQVVDALVAGGASRMGLDQDAHGALEGRRGVLRLVFL